MRLLLILIVAAFAGCGVSPDDSVKKGDEPDDDMHTAADEAQESFDNVFEKAENVEDELADAAEQRRKAIEEASGE